MIPKLSLYDMYSRIERLFATNLGKSIMAKNSRDGGTQYTLELTNYEYALIHTGIKFETEVVNSTNQEEYVERSYILQRTEQISKYLKDDLYSRRASFVNNYDEKDNHCISYFHFYYRLGKLCMNVYVRSQNFDTNFLFDGQTFLMAYELMFNELKLNDSQKGFIRVLTMSLHKVTK